MHLLYLMVLNIFFSIAAILGNTLILVALHNESSLHPPSKLLLRCLATTDICVGLMAQPVCVVYWISLQYCKPKLECLSILEHPTFCHKLLIGFSLSVDVDCNKRGQASRSVVGVAIQTSYNVEANICDYNCHLGCVHKRCNCLMVEASYYNMVWLYRYIAVFSNLNLYLHDDFLEASSTSNSTTRTSKRCNSIEHNAIQESSVYCAVATADINSLLSALRNNRCYLQSV